MLGFGCLPGDSGSPPSDPQPIFCELAGNLSTRGADMASRQKWIILDAVLEPVLPLVELLPIIGKSVPPASEITLVGGCALSLLGSSRSTIVLILSGQVEHN